jgi:hypothetical protein
MKATWKNTICKDVLPSLKKRMRRNLFEWLPLDLLGSVMFRFVEIPDLMKLYCQRLTYKIFIASRFFQNHPQRLISYHSDTAEYNEKFVVSSAIVDHRSTLGWGGFSV